MRRSQLISQSYRRAMLGTPNLGGYWRVGERSSASVAREERGIHHGSYGNAPTMGVPGALAGDPNTAMTCPAASFASLVLPASVPDPGMGSYTALAWVNRAAVGVAHGVWTFGNRFVESAWSVSISSANKVSVWVDDGTTDLNLVSALTLPTAGRWYLVGFMIDRIANVLRTAVDGVLDANTASIAAIGTIVPPPGWRAAGYHVHGGPTDPLNGSLDELAIATRYMTAAEQARLVRIARGF